MAKRGIAYVSDFYCTYCGNKTIPIPRKASKDREPGHLKKIWCPYCKTERNCVEVRPFGSYTLTDFKEEFKAGRFIDGKRIPYEQLDSCNEVKCIFFYGGKCQNATKTYQCKKRMKGNN